MGKGRGGPARFGKAPPEKAKDFKGTLKRLLQFLKPHRLKLGLVTILAALSTAFSIVSPRIMGEITTELFRGVMARHQGALDAGIDFSYIANIIFILAALYLLSAVFNYLQQFIMVDVAQDTVYRMRKEINDKLERLPLKFYDSHTHGEILSRVTNDVDTISNSLGESFSQVITSVILLVGIVGMMLTINPLMTLLVCLVVIPFSLLVTKYIASYSQRHFVRQQRILGDLNGHVEEMYTGHQIVKAYGMEPHSIAKFDQINEDLYDAGWRALFISGIIMPMMNLINNLGYVLVCVVGGIYVMQGVITIGNVQAFIQYAKQFTRPISDTANIANIFQSIVAAAERVFEILDQPEEEADNPDPTVLIPFPRGDVSMQNVTFGYTKDTVVIDDLSIDVQEGQTIAIVGPTGAGKTTLVNLLMRFYELDQGRITVDGKDIRELRRGELRDIFGMVLQDTWLFDGTIKDNIAYGKEGATDEEILKAAQTAYADRFIRSLPEGYDTLLSENAANISQGQKQLLAISRAILADPAILILDEATSSVDTRTEVLIQEAMKRLMKGRTSFVIAHCLSTIREADLILVMRAGQVVEKGTHAELMGKGGLYAELYYSQFAVGTAVQEAH